MLQDCFRPCPRRLLNFLHEGDNVELPFHFTEMELAVAEYDSFIQQCRNDWTLDNFFESMTETILWLSPHCFLAEVQAHAELSRLDVSERSGFTAYIRFEVSQNESAPRRRLFLWMQDAQVVEDDNGLRFSVLRPACELILALMKVFGVSYLKIGLGFTDEKPTLLPVSPEALHKFLSDNELLHHFVIFRFQIDSECCRILGSVHLTHLELVGVLLQDSAAFCNGLQENGGSCQLTLVDPRNMELLGNTLNVLLSNNRLTNISVWANHQVMLSAETLAQVSSAFSDNSSLASLRLFDCPMDDMTWEAFWECLRGNQGIITLRLSTGLVYDHKQATSRTKVVANALKQNTTLCSVVLERHERDEDIWRRCVTPCLERNKYIPRWKAIRETGDESYRGLLFAKALFRLHYCPRLVYLGLQKGVDIVLDRLAPPKAPPMLFLDLRRHQTPFASSRQLSSLSIRNEPRIDNDVSGAPALTTIAASPLVLRRHWRRVAIIGTLWQLRTVLFLLSSRFHRRALWAATVGSTQCIRPRGAGKQQAFSPEFPASNSEKAEPLIA